MDHIMLIGNNHQLVGSVERHCHNCNAAVYVQIENVPLVDNSQGTYSCVMCALAVGEMPVKFLHHGKVFNEPTGAQLVEFIRDVIKRSRGL